MRLHVDLLEGLLFASRYVARTRYWLPGPFVRDRPCGLILCSSCPSMKSARAAEGIGLRSRGQITRLGFEPLADVPGAPLTVGRPLRREAVVDDVVADITGSTGLRIIRAR